MSAIKRLGAWLKGLSEQKMVAEVTDHGEWSPPKSESLMRVLEPRMMYDAAGVLTGLELLSDTPAVDEGISASQGTSSQPDALNSDTETFNPPTTESDLSEESPQEIIFIDTNVRDYQTLIDGLDAHAEVIILDSDADGVAQISTALAERSHVSAIHIVSHGGPGTLQLGSETLSTDTLSSHADALQGWSSALTTEADILIYGCNIAAGDEGHIFVEKLSDLTGVDIAASEDPTGASEKGGDWELEAENGAVETALPFDGDTKDSYTHLLSIPTPTDATMMLQMAEFANAAYTEGEMPEGWEPVSNLDGIITTFSETNGHYIDEWGGWGVLPASEDAAVVVAQREQGSQKIMMISIRGTDGGISELLNEAPSWGFVEHYKTVRPVIQYALSHAYSESFTDIYLTGHSLGGAATQLAIFDILTPGNLELFVSGSDPTTDHLGNGDRILLTDTERAYVSDKILGVTFGAPGIANDPPDHYMINGGLSSVLDEIEERLLNYSHEWLQDAEYYDPIPLLRGDRIGTDVIMDLDSSVNERYAQLGSFPALHGMLAYQESMIRMAMNADLLTAGSLGTNVVTDIGSAELIGTDNSDILAGGYNETLNGRAGNDVFVIGNMEFDPVIEGIGYSYGGDRLVFDPEGLQANPNGLPILNATPYSHSRNSDDLILSISGEMGTITIRDWFTESEPYRIQISGVVLGSNGYLELYDYTIPNAAPVINSESFSVAENASAGTAVGTIDATDADERDRDYLTYSIVGGTGQALFSISNPTTGQITVGSGATLNYDENSNYTLRIKVFDGTVSIEKDITIYITDVNEPPTVANPVVDQSATVGRAFSFQFPGSSLFQVGNWSSRSPAMRYMIALRLRVDL